MKVERGVSEYTKLRLELDVAFPKGREVCRFCPFCVADPRNHKREVCMITGTLLPFADISMEGNCPLKAKEIDENTPGGRIKALRMQLKLTQQELGEKVGTSRGVVNYWEKGKREIKAKDLIALSEALYTTPDYLLCGVETTREEEG